MPPLASRLRLTSCARRSHIGRSAAVSAAPSPATNAGASSSCGRPSAARSAAAAHRVRRVRQVRDAPRDDRLGRRAIVEQRADRPAPGGPAAPCAGTARAARRGPPRSRRGTPRRTSSPRADRGVDLRARVVVLEHDRHLAHVRQPAHGGARVGCHQVREVRCALRRRQAEADVDVPLRRHDAGADEAERGDRLVELRVVDRSERREDARLQAHAQPSTPTAAAGSAAVIRDCGTPAGPRRRTAWRR